MSGAFTCVSGAQALPTPVLVFGGPYSNVRALMALRARADEVGIDASRIFCTGDIVAYLTARSRAAVSR